MISLFWSVFYLYKTSLYIRLYFMWFLTRISQYMTSSHHQPTMPPMTQYSGCNAAAVEAQPGSRDASVMHCCRQFLGWRAKYLFSLGFISTFVSSGTSVSYGGLTFPSMALAFEWSACGVIIGCNGSKEECFPLFQSPRLYVSLQDIMCLYRCAGFYTGN